MSMEELRDDETRVSLIEDAIARAWAELGGTPAAAGSPDATRALLAELCNAMVVAPAEGATDGAGTLGTQLALGGVSAHDVAREILGLVRGLESALAARGITDLDRPQLRRLADAAVVRAMTAYGDALVRRRDAWLSFYAHELRNPLNTLVNAIWLLRNGDRPGQAQRICDMAERAVNKLESIIKEVRALEAKFGTEPPQRAKMPPKG
jgi:signal transduction histidine kinase